MAQEPGDTIFGAPDGLGSRRPVSSDYHANESSSEIRRLCESLGIMNFDRVNAVLGRLVHSAGMPAAKLDSQVQAQLQYLSSQYPRLLSIGRPPVDYSAAATHIAYVYRCAAAHGQWVYHALLAAHSRAARFFKQKMVRVAAVGGGPGSDMLGVMKYSQTMGLTSSTVSFKLLDHEPSWEGVWDEFARTYDGSRSLNAKYEHLDLAKGAPWTASDEFLSADIFTFSFSLSEAWTFNGGGSVTAFLDHVISNSRQGALFVYVDNGGPSFNSRVEAHFNRKDIRLIASSDDNRRLLGADEQASAVGEYRARFGQAPKLTGNVSYRVWEKLP